MPTEIRHAALEEREGGAEGGHPILHLLGPAAGQRSDEDSVGAGARISEGKRHSESERESRESTHSEEEAQSLPLLSLSLSIYCAA